MTDRTIIRVAEESCKVLSKMQDSQSWGGDQRCGYLLPSYNALLHAAQTNYPDDPFLGALPAIEPNGDRDPSAAELHVLFAQLRIGVESLMGESGGPVSEDLPGSSTPAEKRREILTSLREGRLSAEQAAALLEGS